MMNRSTVWAATVIVGAIPTNALITVGKAGMSSSVSRFNLNGIDGVPCARHGIGHASRAQRLRFRGHFPIDI